MTKREREAMDVAGMMERVTRAMVRRAGTGDTEALRELHRLTVVLGEAVTEAGAVLYATGHYSWTDIGAELGISRQAARQRFGPRAIEVGIAWDVADRTIEEAKDEHEDGES